MENHGILGRRRWSVVLKAQIAFAALGALVTIAPLLYQALHLPPLESPKSSLIFQFGFALTFVLIAPAYHVGKLLGVPQSANVWVWNALMIIVNTSISFLFGTIIGWLLKLAGWVIGRLRHITK